MKGFCNALQSSLLIYHALCVNLYQTFRPPNDNRASLLRSATQMKKPISERDVYMNLWRNYVVLACRVVPAITKTPFIRCASPDISLG